ncbi:MAG: MucB/RseB C-terminal domain-containing protein [Zoogloeaceae bacterium]|jgi:sigma-E factor negative regulatory protein RseB|nr:MucB/RseB C-terminal domain-containing protein [Zoogloeaceae bacterium]
MTKAAVIPFLLAALLGLVSFSLRAEQTNSSGEALQLLQKAASSAQKLIYTGVFVYQNDSQTETSRITRLVDGGNEYERLEALDGSPREVIRYNEEVSCYLPDDKLVIIERHSARQLFPTFMPRNLAGLTEHYFIRKGVTGRIAGINGLQISVEPRDSFRFGHQFWIEPNTGLLLKSKLIGEGGVILESFTFTEVKIGGPVDMTMVQPKTAPESSELKDSGWTVQRINSNQVRADSGQWLFKNPLPGFRYVSGIKKKLRPDAPESTQLIFSDGLAAFSVFVEPLAGRTREDASAFPVGAVNVYKRQIGDYQIILMGDIPAVALRRFGDGIEPRRK